MLSEEQRRLLGRFIRSHRERVTPSVPTRRRRTPGLRREELAALAGIGVTWCAWIEQGRDIRVSPEALARLATALALTPAERGYLFELAGRRDPDAPRSEPMPQAPRSVRALDDAAMAHLVAEMKAESALFARLWDAQSVSVREGGQRTFLHPLDGPLAYEQHTFIPAERVDYKLVVLFPEAGG